MARIKKVTQEWIDKKYLKGWHPTQIGFTITHTTPGPMAYIEPFEAKVYEAQARSTQKMSQQHYDALLADYIRSIRKIKREILAIEKRDRCKALYEAQKLYVAVQCIVRDSDMTKDIMKAIKPFLKNFIDISLAP